MEKKTNNSTYFVVATIEVLFIVVTKKHDGTVLYSFADTKEENVGAMLDKKKEH